MIPTLKESTDSLRDLIKGEASEKVREALASYQYLVYSDTQDGQLLEIIKAHDQPASISIQRYPDGTISKGDQEGKTERNTVIIFARDRREGEESHDQRTLRKIVSNYQRGYTLTDRSSDDTQWTDVRSRYR